MIFDLFSLFLLFVITAQAQWQCATPVERVEVCVGNADITNLAVHTVVNAANGRLQHGGGVAFALRRAAGPTLQQESDALVERFGTIATGSTGVTRAGNLPASFVIHAVGPTREELRADDSLLRTATLNTLRTGLIEVWGGVSDLSRCVLLIKIMLIKI